MCVISIKEYVVSISQIILCCSVFFIGRWEIYQDFIYHDMFATMLGYVPLCVRLNLPCIYVILFCFCFKWILVFSWFYKIITETPKWKKMYCYYDYKAIYYQINFKNVFFTWFFYQKFGLAAATLSLVLTVNRTIDTLYFSMLFNQNHTF